MKKNTTALIMIWIIHILFDLFIVRDPGFLFEHLTSERFLVNYIASTLGFLGLLLLIWHYLSANGKKRTAAFVLLFLPIMVQLSYYGVYRRFVNAFGFKAFYEEPTMVFDLWIKNLNLPKILAAAALVFMTCLIMAGIKGAFHRFTVAVSWFVVVAVSILMGLSWYSVPVFQNSVLAYSGSILALAKEKTYTQYKIDKPQVRVTSKNKQLPDIVYIIGESTVLPHMSLFGYERDTTPGLVRLRRENKIVAFDNCISIGLQTRLSVPYMMAGLQGIDPKGYFYTCPTVFNYAKALGYTTAMITAQDFSWGNLKDILIDKDVDVFENGTHFKPDLSVHKGADDPDVLEKGVLPLLKDAKQPFFIVFQMDGSHYPFSEHSRKEDKVFLPETEPNCINAFDNSVRLTDRVVTRLIETVRADHPDAWVFFSPDHGQNLGGAYGFFNDNFSQSVIHNPLIVSAPLKYRHALQARVHAPLSQSDIVATILDLMGVEPVKPIDGLSILRPVPKDRLRVCSTYMPTFHNVPESVLVLPDLSYYYIDHARKSVILPDGKTMVNYYTLPARYRNVFDRRMQE